MTICIIEEESVAAAAKEAIESVWEHGVKVNRTVGTWCMMEAGTASLHEVYNVLITIRNPLKRWNSRVNGSMLTETLDYLLGLNPGYTHRSKWKFYAQWLDKKKGKYPYTYGERIFGCKNEIDQWDEIIRLLKGDTTTRHALLSMYRPSDLRREFVPCNVAWHFQVDAQGKLNMITFCRSQDALRGLLLDAFAYTHFLEQMSLATNLPLGTYTIFEANLHIYDKDASKIGTDFSRPTEPYSDAIHPAKAQLLSEKNKKEINRLLKQIFDDKHLPRIDEIDLPTYWKDCIHFIATEMLAESKTQLKNMIHGIENEDILWTLRRNLTRIGVDY